MAQLYRLQVAERMTPAARDEASSRLLLETSVKTALIFATFSSVRCSDWLGLPFKVSSPAAL